MAEVMKVFACLHSHSTHSDGVYTPEELATVAKNEGYGAFSLTDHDTVSGTADMMAACAAAGLECIAGIEFSTHSRDTGIGFHMTAFGFDPEYPELKDYLVKLSEKETDQTRRLFHRGVEIGYIKNLTWDEVLEYNKGITWLCNEHVFRAMKSKGLITDLDYPEFFETCYGPWRNRVPEIHKFMDVEDLIPIVHAAGGICCIAHPRNQLHGVEHLAKNYGLDGVEVWHAMLDARERREALALARKYDLFVSGGADHEGLIGGEYSRYEHPEETEFYFPPLTLGTTKYFYEEIRDLKKKPDRLAVMDAMLADESLWERTK